MNKTDIYRQTLSTINDWQPYLLQESGLPGPRGNLELAQVVADQGNRELFEHFLAYTPQVAPVNDPHEFLAFCGVLGLGRLLAEGVPTQERTGSCWSTSDVLNRADAWRCMADNSIYDPCFSIPGNSQAVICDTSPLSDSTGFKLNLTESLPARGTVSPVKHVWAFELADGTNCIFMGGATAAFEGKRVNYSCSDGWVILGELQEGQVWTAWKVRLSSDLSSIEESVQVFIKKVWL